VSKDPGRFSDVAAGVFAVKCFPPALQPFAMPTHPLF
jgi:hypothetical protein